MGVMFIVSGIHNNIERNHIVVLHPSQFTELEYISITKKEVRLTHSLRYGHIITFIELNVILDSALLCETNFLSPE